MLIVRSFLHDALLATCELIHIIISRGCCSFQVSGSFIQLKVVPGHSTLRWQSFPHHRFPLWLISQLQVQTLGLYDGEGQEVEGPLPHGRHVPCPVLGHEGLLHYNVLAAGSPHTGNEPSIFYGVVAAGDQEPSEAIGGDTTLPVILPNQFIEYGPQSTIGLVRGVRVDASRPQYRQFVDVEVHI